MRIQPKPNPALKRVGRYRARPLATRLATNSVAINHVNLGE